MKKCLLIVLLLLSPLSWSHEQWLLTAKEMNTLSHVPAPAVFTQISLFNSIVCSLVLCALCSWIFITRHAAFQPEYITQTKTNWALFCLRLWTGLMLILCSLGLLPKFNIALLSEPTLFAPDLLIHSLAAFWHPLQWLELGLGIWLWLGLFIRFAAAMLLILVLLTLILFDSSMMHYSGFYLSIAIFLLINGGGTLSIYSTSKTRLYPYSLLIVQCLTGLNFIYSALCVKWATPMVDIFLLQKTQAFTFGLTYENFAFLMFVVELALGILFLLGRKLQLISLVALCLFLFLSFNFSEHVLAHSFIYGVLSIFTILGGYPLPPKKIQA